MDPIELRRQVAEDLKREYGDSLTDEQRERDRLVDGIRGGLGELDRFVSREAPLRVGTDQSRPPSAARLARLREVFGYVDAAATSARQKL